MKCNHSLCGASHCLRLKHHMSPSGYQKIVDNFSCEQCGYSAFTDYIDFPGVGCNNCGKYHVPPETPEILLTHDRT